MRLIGLAVIAVALATPCVLWLQQRPAVTQPAAVEPPTRTELESAGRLRVFFAHQSVGDDILDGLRDLTGADGSLPVVETQAPPPDAASFIAHAHIGENGDPLGKLAEFARILDGPMGDTVDVALVKLCYLDVVAGTDVEAVFGAYASTMSALERRHRDVRFVYTTVPLTTERSRRAKVKAWFGLDDAMGPADNVARQRYNALVRERYAGTGRLFDVAAVEAALADGATTRSHDGEAYDVLHPALSADAGHLNELGKQAAATALIRVLASTAGSR